MPHKEFRFGDEKRQQLTNAVNDTIGPRGRNVVLKKSFGSPTGTKDSAPVAKEVEDRFKKMGAQMIREIALQHQNSIFKGSASVENEIEKAVTLQQMMST